MSEQNCFAVLDEESNKWIKDAIGDQAKILNIPKAKIVKTEAFSSPLELSFFDWIVLPDILTTEIFLEKINDERLDVSELDDRKICVAGESVSTVLSLYQIHSDVIATKADTEETFQLLKDYISNQFSDLSFLVLKERNQQEKLSQLLQKSGAKVTEISLYELRTDDRKKIAKLKTLIKGGAVDAFVFASSCEVITVKFMFEEDLNELLGQLQVFAADELTFQTLLENGLKPRYFETLLLRLNKSPT